MRYGIALVGDRVAPRCIFAQSVMVIAVRGNVARREGTPVLEDPGLLELAKVVSESRIDVLVCGGISREEREFLASRGVEVIANVAGSTQELLGALQAGSLCPGFGLASGSDILIGNRSAGMNLTGSPAPSAGEEKREAGLAAVDCLACGDHKCLRGEACEEARLASFAPGDNPEAGRMLEASLDISSESERTLCRLSELIYFFLEMRYRCIGLAYCEELQEAAATLARVLRRFFHVYPVCCKIGGAAVSDPLAGPLQRGQLSAEQVACNPRGQAEVLNRLKTDANVLVGLCMGTDCIFSRFSDAPATTLFVKDKALANNPIGAVYSDYYLKEASQAAWCEVGEGLKGQG
jgi:uncharacterized metal-binding protein/predicted Fe-Mo cluster-binding NifX family protein